MSLICRLVGIWETLTYAAFWESLVRPPLVVVNGHLWPDPETWSEPVFDPTEGWVERNTSRCVRCGADIGAGSWRRFWGLLP